MGGGILSNTNKKIILAFILGILISGTSVYAAGKYKASEVIYNNTDVENALNDLYTKKQFGLEKFTTNYNPSKSTTMQLSVEKGSSYVFIIFSGQASSVPSIKISNCDVINHVSTIAYLDVSGSRAILNTYYCTATDNTVKFTSNVSTGFSWVYSKLN